MFTSSTTFPVFDHLRVPYVVDPDRAPGPLGRARRPAPSDGAPGRTAADLGDGHTGARAHRGSVASSRWPGVRLAGSGGHGRARPLLRDGDPTWRSLHDVVDLSGRPVAAVATNDRGDVFLPFDPGEVMQCLWSEGYRALDQRSRVRRPGSGGAAVTDLLRGPARPAPAAAAEPASTTRAPPPGARVPALAARDRAARPVRLAARSVQPVDRGPGPLDRAVARRRPLVPRADPRRRDRAGVRRHPAPPRGRAARRLPVLVELRPGALRHTDRDPPRPDATRAARSASTGCATTAATSPRCASCAPACRRSGRRRPAGGPPASGRPPPSATGR